MDELKLVSVDTDLSGSLITFGLLAVIGQTKNDVIEVWRPLISGSLFLDDAGAQLSLRDMLTGEEILSVAFKAGRCVDQTFIVDTDQQKDCLGELKSRGFRYSPTHRRWSKPGANYAWRIQATGHNKHVVMCRRLLHSK